MWPSEESPLVPASFVLFLRTTALKQCFLALDCHLQAPLTHFEGAGLKNARVSSTGGPQAPKNSHFCSKKCRKWRFFALKWCFLALGVHLQPPLPYFEGAGLRNACVLSIGGRIIRFSGPPAPKNSHFCLKKGQKWRFFALKRCFLALGGHLQPPLPYFEGAGLKNTCDPSIRSLVTSASGPPAPKNSHFGS